MHVFKFGIFGHKWKPNDELYIIVSDTIRWDVSTAHPTRLKNAMQRENFSPHVSAEERAKKLIVPPEDNISVVTELSYIGSVEIKIDVWRHFVFVVGNDFCFKDRIGREYITSTANLVASFGPVNGPVVEDVILNRVPHVNILQPQVGL